VVLLLGTSPAADAFVLAFWIPSIFRRLTGEGSFGAAFIPVFTNYLGRESPAMAWDFARKIFWDMAALLAVVSALGVVFSRQVIAVYTLAGGHEVAWSLAVYLNRIMFPAVLFIGLASLATAILHSFRVFGLPASSSIFFNLALVTCSFGVVYRPIVRWAPNGFRTPAVALAVGILAGGMLQLAIQLPALVRRGLDLRPSFSVSDPGVRKVARLMGPSFLGMGVYQINLFVNTIFATSSRMPTGSVTSLYIADRVMQLVLGSYAIAMSTALLPAMSHQMAAGNWDEMKRTFGFSLRVVSFITVPAAVGLILLRRPIIQVMFQHGQFGPSSAALTAHALFFYSLGLPAFAAIRLIAPMYYSTQDTLTPALVGVCALALNIALNLIFLFFFFRTLSNGSPALASVLAAYFNFGALFFLFRKRFGRLGTRGLVASLARIAVCATAMAAVTYLSLHLSRFAQARHLFMQAGILAAMIAASTGVYFGLAWLLRSEELSELLLVLRSAEPQGSPVAGS
jgi:putative peptidoglycan lipid II flippase